MKGTEINLRSFLFRAVLFCAIASIVFFGSCKKYEEEIVPNNTSAPDLTVDEVTIENYINKVYISAIGREPTVAEKDFAAGLLGDQDMSVSSRNRFLDSVLTKPEFKNKFYDRAKIDLLGGLDTSEITLYIYVFQVALLDTSQMAFWSIYQNEVNRLQELKDIPSLIASNQITFIEIHHRCINNFFYDQINMGSFNFVVSVFQHFLDRYPTTNELNAGVSMVDGISAVLFLVTGQSKSEFESIFLESKDYYEGQVRSLYRKYLYRLPTSVEMTDGTILYMENNDYIKLQKSILSSDAFAGL